jgi:UDP-glucose 4-epimerase
MTRVLVTGGAGFVGSAIVHRLVRDGHDVAVLDNFFRGRRENLEGLDVVLEHGSVTDRWCLDRVAQDCDVIVHAACRPITCSLATPTDDVTTNVLGTTYVLDSAVRYKARVILLSSTSVHGDVGLASIDEGTAPGLTTVHTPYSASKLAGELMAAAFVRSYGLPVTTFRLSNVYGPRQWPDNPDTGIVARLIYAALTETPVTIHGDGEDIRDYTFVEDVADLVASALRGPTGTYLVGTGVGTSTTYLVALVATLLRSALILDEKPPRPTDTVRRRVVAAEQTCITFGWAPHTALPDGLKETAAWMKRAIESRDRRDLIRRLEDQL